MVDMVACSVSDEIRSSRGASRFKIENAQSDGLVEVSNVNQAPSH